MSIINSEDDMWMWHAKHMDTYIISCYSSIAALRFCWHWTIQLSKSFFMIPVRILHFSTLKMFSKMPELLIYGSPTLWCSLRVNYFITRTTKHLVLNVDLNRWDWKFDIKENTPNATATHSSTIKRIQKQPILYRGSTWSFHTIIVIALLIIHDCKIWTIV